LLRFSGYLYTHLSQHPPSRGTNVQPQRPGESATLNPTDLSSCFSGWHIQRSGSKGRKRQHAV